jgi:hypothetical protein
LWTGERLWVARSCAPRSGHQGICGVDVPGDTRLAAGMTLRIADLFAGVVPLSSCEPAGCGNNPGGPYGPMQSSCGGDVNNCTSTIGPNGQYTEPGAP